MTTIWMVKPGYDKEYEAYCIEDNRVFLSLPQLAEMDFTEVENYAGIRALIEEQSESLAGQQIIQLADDMADFCLRMTRGDLVLMPLTEPGRVAIGKILSPYGYDSANPAPLRHLRDVEWITKESFQKHFDEGVTKVLNEKALIARVTHPAAERQVFSEIGKAIQKTTWREDSADSRPLVTPEIAVDSRLVNPVSPIDTQGANVSERELPAPGQDRVRVSLREDASSHSSAFVPSEEEGGGDIRPEVWSRVEGYINRHGLLDLVQHILTSDGYQIGFVERTGAQSALFQISRGRFGFESPRVLVNLIGGFESLEAGAIERLKTLAGAQNMDAILVVGWHAPSADIRSALNLEGLQLWTGDDILSHLLRSYETLPGTVQAEIGLRRIWTV